jgi:lincosamide nucleotidyltransferase A/C/D/E
MEQPEVFSVLDALDVAGVRWWVAGGWGVDVLIGRQTRAHRDLDLLVDAATYDACLAALGALGYAPETDWLPLRIELAAPGERWVDVHPVVFDATGVGTQGQPPGVTYTYPPSVLTEGHLGGRRIPCLTAELQRELHAGYEPRPEDLYDLALLERL